MKNVIGDWLLQNNLSQSAFARKIGIKQSSLNYIINKKRAPSRTTILKIHEISKGEIDVIELLKLDSSARVEYPSDSKYKEGVKKKLEHKT